MAVDTLRGDDSFAFNASRSNITSGAGHIARYVGYGVLIALYGLIFAISLATLSLIEIRQANLKDSNALIAMLEQRDRYGDIYLGNALDKIRGDRAKYQTLYDSLLCPDGAAGFPAEKNGTNVGPNAQGTEPKSCREVKATVNGHLNALWLMEDSLLFRKANLPEYYDRYADGLREKTPQLVPVLRFMDSNSPWLTEWTRLPFELLEMLLLICMGALGGVISVTRCFVDRSTANPSARDLCYRPAAGAVIALGIYVLFRVGQLFFGASGQDAAATASTSIFILAFLGLASGFCAGEAVRQIELAATRLLRRSEGGGSGGGGGPAPGLADAAPESGNGAHPSPAAAPTA